MPDTRPDTVREVDRLYRSEARAVFATLVRLLGEFELAEEALHDAFRTALEQWPQTGLPANPRAWLISTGRHKALDWIRRRARWVLPAELPEIPAPEDAAPDAQADELIGDDQLRLIFTCCHPQLSTEARVALTLREVCGLTTEEIARAFLARPATIAQRIVRAKNRIREARIPFAVPGREAWAVRLDTVLQVIYLVFNEGYAASGGDTLLRADLSGEAIRLGQRLWELIPETEVRGLLALMLLQDSRRLARVDQHGDLVLLEDQDRSLWNQEQIVRGRELVAALLAAGLVGPYGLQAAIAAEHASAAEANATNWPRIVHLYDQLLRLTPSPVVALNRAVALAMRDGPASGLAEIDQLLATGELADYLPAHAARADLNRRLGRVAAAREAYATALTLSRQSAERRFLERRLAAL